MRHALLSLLWILTACTLAACGSEQPPAATPVQTPPPPFARPNVGTVIDIIAPFETASGQYESMNLLAGIPVPAGHLEFDWTAVPASDGYLVLVFDTTDTVRGVDPEFETVARQWSTATSATVDLGEPGRMLLLQIFAYRGVDVLGQSEVWAMETAPE